MSTHVSRSNRLHVLPEAAPWFDSFDADNLTSSRNTIIGIDADGTIVMLNPAYFQFAADNGGTRISGKHGLGTNLFSAIVGKQRRHFEEFCRGVIQTQQRSALEYECSSPTAYRYFCLIAYPVGDGHGILLDHALSTERPHDRESAEFDTRIYVDQDGILHQCGHCRRIKRPGLNQWDWCPQAWDYGAISHGLCNSCLDFYYPEE